MFGDLGLTELILVVGAFMCLVGVVFPYLRKSEEAEEPTLIRRPSIVTLESSSSVSNVSQGEARQQSKEENPVQESGRLIKKCPFCAEDIQEAALKCKHCGSVIPRPQPCPYCSKRIQITSKFCQYCGNYVSSRLKVGSDTSGASASQTIVRTAKSRGIFIIFGLFLGLLGIHNFYAGYYGKGVVQLAITVVLGSVYIGIIITAIWVIAELFTVKKDADGNVMA